MNLISRIKSAIKESNWDAVITHGISLRTIFEFVVISVALFVVGWIVNSKVTELLESAHDDSVSRHINRVAYIIESQFERRLNDLHLNMKLIEQGDLTAQELIRLSGKIKWSNTTGIIAPGGKVFAGDSLTNAAINDLSDLFLYGKEVVSYHKEGGLLFAVPINIDGQRYAYWEQYDDARLPAMFGISSYDGEGRVNLANRNGEWVTLTKTNDYTEKLYNYIYETDPNAKNFFKVNLIDNVIKYGKAIARYKHEGNEYLLFGKKIYNDKFELYGIVRREAFSIGVNQIHVIMIVAFCFLILLLIMSARATIKTAQNRELERERQSAIQASKTKSEFLSNMSHEIRTPINAILGMDEMILREAKDSDILEYAENLRHAGVSLLGIVNDILDFSKIEAGKMEIIPVEYHVSSILNDLINMVQTRADKKGLQFIAKADPNIPSVLYGDEIRIKQIITNILTNAVKYTEKGSVTLTVEYKDITQESIYLIVSVKDTGIGIKEEDIAKLFSAFERIEEKRNRTIEGTGLGMNITQQLLRLMNTKLNVESVYGQGSTFSFELEQKVVNREPIGNFEDAYKRSLSQHKEYHEKFMAPTARILVVDDTVMNLTVVKGLLKQTKIKIDTCESGYDCLKLVAKTKYDVIFLDHRMPGMDGIETLKAMHEMTDNQNVNTPVISLTANAISGAREQYIEAGFQDYLTKPIDSVHLENLLIKYLPQDKVKVGGEEKITEIPQEELKLPAWLSEVKGISTAEGIKHCGGIEEYLDAVKIFANSINTASYEIENYYNNEDWKNYTTKVHALKSSAKVIGAQELSERAKRLEDAGNSNYINEIREDTEPLLKLYRSYAEALKPLIEVETNNNDKPLIEEAELAEAYETMREFASSFDYDSMQFVIDSLNEYKLPEEEAERYKKIKEAVAKLDWETVKELLR